MTRPFQHGRSARARALRSAALYFAVLLAGCSEMTAPLAKPVTTGPPAVAEHAIALDYDTRVGTFTLTAADPDTLVAVQCEGAFAGSGINTVAISRPFAELRHHPFLSTICHFAAAGDAPTYAILSEVPDPPLDSAPRISWPEPAELPRVNVPVLFTMQAEDDWGIVSHWIYYARGDDIYACSQQWVRARTTDLPAPVREVTETITLTFSEPGHYCIGFAARDDFAPVEFGGPHGAGAVNYIEVAAE
jgi:hypothetical protein